MTEAGHLTGMHVVVDGSGLARLWAGVGTYTAEILRALAAERPGNRFTVVGGSALMPGVDRSLSGETGIPFRTATDPQSCAVRGTRRALGDFELVHRRQLYMGGR